jgi:polyisoprenoid-binding protein YceI
VSRKENPPILRNRALRLAFSVFALAFAACSAPGLRAQQIVVTLDPAQTKVEFNVGATLHTVHGSFRLKSGQIRFDPATGKAGGEIVVDATSGSSENDGRDKKMHQQVLESRKFPDITFTPTLVKGAIALQNTYQMEISGIFHLHGQDHDLTVTVSVEPGGSQIQATTKFSIPYAKWGLKNPSTFLLKVDDTVEIQIHSRGQLEADPGGH